MKKFQEFIEIGFDTTFVDIKRIAARAVIVEDSKVLMIHAKKYDDYTFPGGGLEDGETPESTCIREAKEEIGYRVSIISELGSVVEYRTVQGSKLRNNNMYYYCKKHEFVGTNLLDYEKELGFEAVFIDPKKAIKINEKRIKITGDNTYLSQANFILGKVIENL